METKIPQTSVAEIQQTFLSFSYGTSVARDPRSECEGPRLIEAPPSRKSVVTVEEGGTFKCFHPEVTCIIFPSYSLDRTSPMGTRDFGSWGQCNSLCQS